MEDSVKPAALRVLIVDDEAALASVIQRHLQGKGHEAAAARSAEDAFLLLDGPPAFRPDVILLDMVLGSVSGLRVLPALAARTGAPIAVMTGHCDEDVRKDALLVGAREVLGKPLDFETLDSVLRRLAARD